MSELYKHIGEKIRDLRTASGLSQDALAKALKIAPNTISRWETGTYKPTAEDLDRLARFFNVSITIFFPDLEKQDERVAMLTSATGGLNEADFAEVIRYAEFRKARNRLAAAKRPRTKR